MDFLYADDAFERLKKDKFVFNFQQNEEKKKVLKVGNVIIDNWFQIAGCQQMGEDSLIVMKNDSTWVLFMRSGDKSADWEEVNELNGF